MAFPDSTENRLSRLIDYDAYRNDPYYKAATYAFKAWLRSFQIAMEDEAVDPEIIECVLNRVVFGIPSPAVAHERMEMLKHLLRATDGSNPPAREGGNSGSGG